MGYLLQDVFEKITSRLEKTTEVKAFDKGVITFRVTFVLVPHATDPFTLYRPTIYV